MSNPNFAHSCPVLLNMKKFAFLWIFIFSIFSLCTVYAQRSINGFDLSDTSIPANEIFHGGPQRDGIPSIDSPKFLKAGSAGFLRSEDRVLGVFHNGVAKAYPVRIMNYHEIVNDNFSGKPVVITYCPLCGSGIAFNAEINHQKVEFGVSGLLYNSDVLMYDRKTETLWSQMMMEAVNGKLKGSKLEPIDTYNTTWKAWRKKYPGTLVLSNQTGFYRDYNRTPYRDYEKRESIFFPISNKNNDYHAKEMVLGITVKGSYRAYPFSELAKSDSPVKDKFKVLELLIVYDAESKSAELLDPGGAVQIISFWFAWYTFHPGTSIYRFK